MILLWQKRIKSIDFQRESGGKQQRSGMYWFLFTV